MSGLLRKVDQAINPEKYEHGVDPVTGAPLSGPHAPATDPRLMPGHHAAAGHAAPVAGHAAADTHHAHHGHHGTHSAMPPQDQYVETSAGTGPHKSKLLNRLDPTVGAGFTTEKTAPTAQPHSVQPAPHHAAGAPMASQVPEGTHPPHRSHLANVLDPRVDADHDGTQREPEYTHGPSYDSGYSAGYNAAIGQQSHGHHGHHGHGRHGAEGHQPLGPTAAHGPAATAPYVHGAAASGPGPAPNTAGPHKSDLLNKLDPRVESRPEAYEQEGGYGTRRT